MFNTPPKMMNIGKDKEAILNIAREGALTAKLHASVLLPDVFGSLTEEDREKPTSMKRSLKSGRGHEQ